MAAFELLCNLNYLHETAKTARSLSKSFSESLPVRWGLCALISLYSIKISDYLLHQEKGTKVK